MTSHICARCKVDFSLKDFDMEPTKYCDGCAHDMVQKLEKQIKLLRKQMRELKGTNERLLR